MSTHLPKGMQDRATVLLLCKASLYFMQAAKWNASSGPLNDEGEITKLRTLCFT